MRPLHAALGLLALAGCTLFDTREIRFDPPGPYFSSSGGASFTVRGRGVAEVEVWLDGRLEGRRPVGEPTYVGGVLARGLHRLELVAVGPQPAPRASTTVEVGPFALVGLSPPPGVITTGLPLVLDVETTLPLGEGARLLASRPDGSPLGSALDYAREVLGARKHRYTLLQPLDVLGDLRLELEAHLPGGGVERILLGAYTVPKVSVEVSLPGQFGSTVTVRDVAHVTVIATGELPETARLLAGDLTAATLTGPGPWNLDWDVSGLPDGRYELRYAATGRQVSQARRPTVVVDRTPPRLLTCRPTAEVGGVLDRASCLEVGFSEPTVGELVLLADGQPVDGFFDSVIGTDAGPIHRLCTFGGLPFGAITVAPGTVVDEAGNPPAAFSCGGVVSRWLQPFGPGPISTGSGEVRAGAAVAGTFHVSPGAAWASLAWLSAGEAPRSAASPEGTGLVSSPVVSRTASASQLAGDAGRGQGRSLAWVEQPASGPPRVAVAWQAFGASSWTELDQPSTAGAAAADPAVYGASSYRDQFWMAWTEDMGAGRAVRAASVSNTSQAGKQVHDLGSSTSLAPVALASSPALFFGDGDFTPTLAWVEDAGDGVGRIRCALAAAPPATWYDFGASLNADPALGAGPPAISMRYFSSPILAWSEQGRLVLRERDSSAGAWGAPQVLNADLAASAEQPVFLQPPFGGVPIVLAWVERGATDRILARALDGDTWTLLEGAANDGVAGAVASLRVSGDVVTWTDELGRVHARALNR